MTACSGRDLGAPAPPDGALERQLAREPTFHGFYAGRSYRPVWTGREGLSPHGKALREMLGSASRYGLDTSAYRLAHIDAAMARDSEAGQANAELLLSEALLAHLDQKRRPRSSRPVYLVDADLAPPPLDARKVLALAARSNALAATLEHLAPSHPFTRALESKLDGTADEAEAALLRANLGRARMLPGDGRKHIVVDVGSARLWMFENNESVGSMRVIAGKPGTQTETPMMAGYVRFAMANPHWNVPPDLVRNSVAASVLEKGLTHLDHQRLTVRSGYKDDAETLDPAEIDWKAVHSGERKVYVRQLPGGANMLGRVKFMFPNRLGIYLHDTPGKHLFERDDRWLSNGCVRVEDAERLWAWLFGKVPLPASAEVEERFDLPEPVPVYITYLTALPFEQAFARRDIYGLDGIVGAKAVAAR